MSNIDSGRHTNNKLAFVFGILSAFSLSIMVLFVKLTAPYTTSGVIIASRFLISFMYILIILGGKYILGNPVSLQTQKPLMHLIRALFGLLSMLFLYYALRFISLVDGTLLSMTNALFIPIIAWLFFGVKTSKMVIFAIFLGFIGVVLVIHPWSSSINIHDFYALGSGVSTAISIILLREIARIDGPYVIMFYYFASAFIISIIIAACDWVMPSSHVILLLLCIGIFGTLYHDFLIRASGYAPAAIVSVFLYCSIGFSAIFDLVVWKVTPNICTCIGLLIICFTSYITVVTSTKPITFKIRQ